MIYLQGSPMVSAWFLNGLGPARFAEQGLLDNLAHAVTGEEYLVLLGNGWRFDRLLRKDDLLDEGVAAIFGLAGAEAELLALCFHATKFTPTEVKAWLAERRFTLSADVPVMRGSPWAIG
jgi:hypothetical protein